MNCDLTITLLLPITCMTMVQIVQWCKMYKRSMMEYPVISIMLTLEYIKHFPILDLPDEKPRITGIKEKYQIGETLEALCTSWQSHPPANLTWFINEEKVKAKIITY